MRIQPVRSFRWLALLLLAQPALSPSAAASGFEELITQQQPGKVYETNGVVRFKPATGAETNAAVPQPLGFGEALRTLELSGAAMRLTDLSNLRIKELTRLEIIPRAATKNAPTVRLYQGEIHMTSRAGGSGVPIEGPGGRGTPKGTEFVVSVDPDTGKTTFTMFDGQVEMSNSVSPSVLVKSGFQGIAEAGQPIRVERLEAKNIIQWWIYYPGILDLDELQLSSSAQANLSASLAAYRRGSPAQALEKYPGYPQPQAPVSDNERAYLAALLLSVGAVDKAQAQLDSADSNASPIRALRIMIDAVSQDFSPSAASKRRSLKRFEPSDATTASESLALSYRHQAEHNLEPALAAARDSVKRSTNFGFGWARVAELEFSLGHISAARTAVKRALELTPDNAHARTVNGFLLAADSRIKEAIAQFDKAIQLDPALGDAWLGRGLCKIRLGSRLFSFGSRVSASGLEDLEAAAALEPHRSLLRSYAGKAFTEAGDARLAEKELNFARKLDPNDPTPSLYAALLKQQENRINEAIADLETSQELNDNRSLFRSRQLLDEDRAVRSANLASIYRDAGMNEVSIREAARAVTSDYGNDSAHLFLSDSYNELRDPTRFNLRYQTVWFNELLLANLLSPVGGGRLSQNLSQQEYSRLFEADGLGLASSTLARSDGRFQELASQFGTFGRTSYSLDLDYEHNNGIRPNNDLDSIEWYSTVKQQFTPHDTALLLLKYQDYHSGDNFQYYNPTNASRHFRFDEYEHPVVIGGWHHEWSPGMHTLVLGGRLANEQRFSDPAGRELSVAEFGNEENLALPTFGVSYHGQLETYTAELNQIFQYKQLTISAGGRYQWGAFDTSVTLTNPPGAVGPPPDGLFTNAFDTTSTSAEFERITGYGYLTLEPLHQLWLTGGLVYDAMTYPSNFRHPPISPGEDHRSLLGPKAALVWEALPQVTLRGIYAKSLGGVSLDDSYRLEPTQLAGFPQAFRNLIPESVVGSIAAPEYQTYGGALDLKFASGTYAGLQFQRLESNLRRTIGYFLLEGGNPPYQPRSMPEALDYRESSIVASLNKLLGREFVVGVNYKFAQAELLDAFPQIPLQVLREALPDANRTQQANLHEASGYVLFNHPSGFFARAHATWYHQHNSGYSTPLPGDDFVQENLYIGYRFFHRRAEITLGILNLSDQDYRLNPLNVYAELPRERTFMASLKFQF